MTLFGHDPLEAAGILVVIASAIVVGWAVWRSKTAEVAAAAVDTWKELAQGYQEKLEQRDQQIADMKEQHAAESATRRAEIEDLRRQIAKLEEDLSARDQTAVLTELRSHEMHAQKRRDEQKAEHTEAMSVFRAIADTQQKILTTLKEQP